ncbi:hypothetical protein ABIA32_003562 [Streptacidiphilus sp. MAP12-20]|uniref:hypothetical protein n=1 Tax=Streptacidiphilus sp. MAP12-20 TaxID=3156299 RepID=UPI0035150541
MQEFHGQGVVYTQGRVSPEHQPEIVSHPGMVMFDGPWVHIESPPQSGRFKTFPMREVTKVTWTRS